MLDEDFVQRLLELEYPDHDGALQKVAFVSFLIIIQSVVLRCTFTLACISLAESFSKNTSRIHARAVPRQRKYSRYIFLNICDGYRDKCRAERFLFIHPVSP
jgi:hypothetical protein